MKNNIVGPVRSLVLFVICMLGAFRAEAKKEEEGRKVVPEYTFHIRKLPRTTTPQEMKNAGYVYKTLDEIGGSHTCVNLIGRAKPVELRGAKGSKIEGCVGPAEIKRFDGSVGVWCVENEDHTFTAVLKDGCFNPFEQTQEPVAQQQEAPRCSLAQYVQDFVAEACGSVAAGVNALQCVQEHYPQYYSQCYQQAPQCVRQCVMPPQQVSNTTVNIVTNTSYTKNVWVNQHCATAPPSTYCPPTVGSVIPSSTRTGAVAYNGATGSAIPRNANGDATVRVSLPGDPGYVAPSANGRKSSQQLEASASAPAATARTSAKVSNASVASAAAPTTPVTHARQTSAPAAPLAANARLTTAGVIGRMSVPKAAVLAANKAPVAPVANARQAGIPRASAVIPPASKVAQAAAVRSSVPRGNAVFPAAKVRSMIPPASQVAKQFQSASPTRNPYGSSVPRNGLGFVPQARNSVPLASNYRSPVSNYRAPVNNYRAPVNNYRAPVNNYRAPVNNYRAPAVSYNAPRSYSVAPSGRRGGK